MRLLRFKRRAERRSSVCGVLRAACLATALVATQALAAAVEIWAPTGISTDQFESHAAFDTRSGDVYFVRSTPQFQRWRIFVARCARTGWVEPTLAPFALDVPEADPFITRDGRRLYFISARDGDHKDLDIWFVDRAAGKNWGPPQRLPEPINSKAAEWFPRPGADGWLYFGSDRPGGLGGTDIWRAKLKARVWEIENLGPSINTKGDEYEALPSADGRELIVMADGGLWASSKGKGRWTPKSLIREVVENGSELGATLSPSGRSLLFSRDTKAPRSGEFFVWRRRGHEAWPPRCRGADGGPEASLSKIREQAPPR